MKEYQVQISVLGTVDGESAEVWSDRGTIKGRSMSSMLRRAYYSLFNGNFDAHPQEGSVLFHNKYHDKPVLRLVEKVCDHEYIDCSYGGPDSGNMDHKCKKCGHYVSVPLY